MSGFYKLVEQMFPETGDQVLIANQLSQFRSGQGFFGREIAHATSRTMPAYQWWQNFGASVPELQSLAVKVLSQTASSSEAERNWSLFGFVQGKKRFRLKPSTMETLVYISTPTHVFWIKSRQWITKKPMLNGKSRQMNMEQVTVKLIRAQKMKLID